MLDDKHIKEEIAGNWDRASRPMTTATPTASKARPKLRSGCACWTSWWSRGDPRQVLDGGAGTGIITLLLARLGHQCKGPIYRKTCWPWPGTRRRRRVDNDLRRGDAEDTGEASGSYDVVINRHLV